MSRNQGHAVWEGTTPAIEKAVSPQTERCRKRALAQSYVSLESAAQSATTAPDRERLATGESNRGVTGGGDEMRLSDAIRLGSMLKPKGDGELLTAEGATCALGAALDAVGLLDEHGQDAEFDACREQWPCLQNRYGHPVETCWPHWALLDVILDLNDCLGWTRERIAEWVQGIEEAHEPATERSAVDPCEGSDRQLATRA